MQQPRIAILTFCVGADYTRAMEPGLASKRAYAAKHGYDFIYGGADVWDRSRPAPWSKLNFIQKYLDSYDYLFWSDADVIIMNTDLRLEDHILPLLPANKDMLWCRDVCDNINNGNMLLRGRSAWLKDFLQRAYAQTDLVNHIWWDNAGMLRLYESNATDKAMIETSAEHWKFNAYLFKDMTCKTAAQARLYEPGDFLVHFAGVYDPWNIYRFMTYLMIHGNAINEPLLEQWRKLPPKNKADADESVKNLTA
jgi:hypothetical protein